MEVIRRLAGVEIDGILYEEPKINGYSFSGDSYSFDCVPYEGGWAVIDLNAHQKKIWTDVPPDDTVASSSKTIDMFIREMMEGAPNSVHCRFSKYLIEGEVHRKYYDSDLGPVVYHTKKVGADTHTAIEMVTMGACITFLWEARLGGVSSRTIKLADSVPF